MNLFVVGRNTDGFHAWELQGVFSTEERAKAACRDETYFIGPVNLDQSFPHETEEWIGAYYPLEAKA